MTALLNLLYATPSAWPALEKDDAGLKQEIEQLLASCTVGDPYTNDGSFAACIARFPPGLRAMAATHWLDISLNLDSITWRFGNCGEPGLVAETEAGLRELGLEDLATCFAEAKHLMQRCSLSGQRLTATLTRFWRERAGLKERAGEIDRRARALDNLGTGDSVI
jgi:hypothetical protein